MKRRGYIIILAILLIPLLVSCDLSLLVSNGEMLLLFNPDVFQEMKEEIIDIYDNYDSITSHEGTFGTEELRVLCNYSFSLYPEIGTFENIKPIQELAYSNTSFKIDENVTFRIGEKTYIEDNAFILDREFLNGSAPVFLLELIFGDPLIKVNGNSYRIENFPVIGDSKTTNVSYYNGSSYKVIKEEEDIIYTVYGSDKEKSDCLEINFEDKALSYFTKTEFFKGGQKIKTLYSFTRPEDNGALTLYPYESCEEDFETINYYICILDENNDILKKQILLRFNR